MKKILVFVPHPDDELLVAGALIYTLRRKYDITVAYYTNGDAVPGQGEIRIHEAIEALKVLGVQKDRIIFLGYGNNWRGGKHIYNLTDEEEAVSCAGQKETYCLDEHPEYYRLKFGKHHLYTRRNIKNDIKSLVMEMRADILICVDFDSHPDHRALSLLFEEVLADILRHEKGYTPIVLKKFAYFGMLDAVWDYYHKPVLETRPGYKQELFDQRYELDNPIYGWDDRIQFQVDRRTRTRYVSRNVLYRAASKHRSQQFNKRVGKFANADMVYWQRRTDGLSYRAIISASSGKAEYVNDFKMIDCPDILCGKDGVVKLQNCVWIPEADDAEKRLFIDFLMPVRISKIYLYENFLPEENILKAKLSFDTGVIIRIDNINHWGRKTEIVFDTQYGVKHMEFQILAYEGTQYGLTELEIYEDNNEQTIPLECYKGSKGIKGRSIENDIDILLEKKFFSIKEDNTKDNKYYRLYQLLLKWNVVGNPGIENWLKKRGYINIALYGMGDLGRKLCDDLENTEICTKYALDKMAGVMTAPFPVLHPDLLEDIETVDAVIVTVIAGFDAIKEKLIEKGYEADKIISLEKIIDEVRYS